MGTTPNVARSGFPNKFTQSRLGDAKDVSKTPKMSSQYLRQAFLFSQNRWLNLLSEEETFALSWYDKLCSDES